MVGALLLVHILSEPFNNFFYIYLKEIFLACNILEDQNIVHASTKKSQLLQAFEDHITHEF